MSVITICLKFKPNNEYGEKERKNIPSPALFSTIACCLMAVIFLKNLSRFLLEITFLLFGPEKDNINVPGSKL